MRFDQKRVFVVRALVQRQLGVGTVLVGAMVLARIWHLRPRDAVAQAISHTCSSAYHGQMSAFQSNKN